MEKQFQELLLSASNLSKIEEFEKEINYRPFELEITKIASSYKMNEELEQYLISQIEGCYKTNKKLSFVIFFILFTMCRRQNYGDILELVKES